MRRWNVVFWAVMLCCLVSGMVWADDPNYSNQITEVSDVSFGGTSGFSCGWEIAAVRNGTSAEGSDGGQLTIELNTCYVPFYEIERFPQLGGSGGNTEVEAGSLIIVWDEDDGHGTDPDYYNFTFSGTIETLVEADYQDYLSLSTTISQTNWTVFHVITDGTFVKSETGKNEHEILHLTVSYIDLSIADDVPDGQCRVPEDEITYEICYTNITQDTFTDVGIVSYLPEGVTYPEGLWRFDPNLNPIEPDPNYCPDTHSYTWELGTLAPNDSGCVEITVEVNEQAQPGGFLLNRTEAWENIAQGFGDTDNLLAVVMEETPVCCWGEPNIIYVDEDASGLNTGTDWDNAYSGPDAMQNALDRVGESTCPGAYTIYAAEGTYTPGPAPWDSFVLPDNVYLYGGFPTGGSALIDRDPRRYETVLTGQIDPNTHNETIVIIGDNVLLDGFTVTKSTDYGVYGDGVDFSIENCKILSHEQWGIYLMNGDSTVKWCVIANCGFYGIYHDGQDYELVIENCQIIENQQFGIFCIESTPTIKNSVIAQNDKIRLTDPLYMFGHEGVYIENPTDSPILHNNTIAHNHGPAVRFTDDASHGDPNILDYPDMQNCIIWYNNLGYTQISGFDETHIEYSCIYDGTNDPDGTDYTPDANYNFSGKPGFAYFNPDNVHLDYSSPCKNAGNPNLTYTNQADMDDAERVADNYVDIGADEVTCEDTTHPLDANIDSIINYFEYSTFASAWGSHDPNDPAWLNDPNLVVPELSEGWYEWKYVWNFADTGASQYVIDAADLSAFVEDTPWLWRACWMDGYQQMQMMGSESMSMEMSFFGEILESESQSMYADIPPAELDKLASDLSQMLFLVNDVIEDGPAQAKEFMETREFLLDALLEIQAVKD